MAARQPAAERPGTGLSVFDAQPKKVTVDAELNEVPEGSPDAAFVFLAADLEAARERRSDLGFESRQKSQAESRKNELARAEADYARRTADIENLRAAVAADEDFASKSETKASSKASKADDNA